MMKSLICTFDHRLREVLVSLLQDLTSRRPDIFHRHTLEMSFKLLRHKCPSLALELQNILAGKSEGCIGSATLPPHLSRNCQYFMVTIDAPTVGKIVSAITRVGQKIMSEEQEASARRTIILSVLEDWMELVEWMINETEEQELNPKPRKNFRKNF